MSALLPEDWAFFLELFQDPSAEHALIIPHFDLRPASVKRAEFARMRNGVLNELLSRKGAACMLAYPGICEPTSGWEVDHLIPLQSNELNKRLRGMVRVPPKKVPQCSYGSNHPVNLILACARCNGHKKHRFLTPGHMHRVLTLLRSGTQPVQPL